MAQHNYSNPRTVAVFEDWPYGQLRTRCTFQIEHVPGKGDRAVRTTVNPKNGRINKPKLTTFASVARIVDGDDGRTYVLELVRGCSHLHVWQSDLQHDEEVIFPDNPRYYDLVNLLRP